MFINYAKKYHLTVLDSIVWVVNGIRSRISSTIVTDFTVSNFAFAGAN